ncbi:MAG: pyridoxamine 5'-phosphate oxidase family protein [Thermodesulfobacteriota bacterium]
MRRKEREIKIKEEMESIIRRSSVCRLAMIDGNHPYIIPLCFGYTEDTLFFHSAPEGKKIDILKINNSVCVEFDTDQEFIKNETACKWGLKYTSVLAFGKASFIENPDEKRKALDVIMSHYSDAFFSYSSKDLEKIVVIKVVIHEMTGKRSA